MRNLQKTLRAAIVQASPVMFNKKATLQKVACQIKAAGQQGAQLIVFPESLVPCYPYGLTFGFTVGSRSEAERADWKRYYDQSVIVREDLQDIAAAAQAAGAYVSLGITERDETTYSLYCSNVIFAPDGTLAAHHRKSSRLGQNAISGPIPMTRRHISPSSRHRGGPWVPSSAGKTTCPWPGRPSTRRASASIWHRIRTITQNGRIRSNTSPSKGAATSSTSTSILPRTCIRQTWLKAKPYLS